jgi:hypothetical protein
MATTRERNWFFQGSSIPTWRRFRENNRPNESTFKDLLQSMVMKLESSDTATTSNAGHVKLATSAEVLAGTDSAGGHSKVVKPSLLPYADVYAPGGSTNIYQHKLAGLQVNKMSDPSGTPIYVFALLYDSDYFEVNVDDELTFSTAFTQLITDLSALIPVPGGGPVFDIDDFPATAFTNGGVINNGGVFTVDADDSTMEVDGVTFKVKIKDNGVTLAKIQTLNPGDVIVGETGTGNPIVVNISAKNDILIGTGIGVEAVDITTLLASLSIADDTILARKLAPTTFGNGLTRDMAASDASKMHIDLSTAASMEFSGAKLQLVNDDASPSNRNYYGTDLLGVKGYNSLDTFTEMYMEEFTLGADETTITINPDDITIPATTFTKIKAGYCNSKLYIKTGDGPYILTEQVDPAIITVSGISGATDHVDSIDYTALTPETDYLVVIEYRRCTTA